MDFTGLNTQNIDKLITIASLLSMSIILRILLEYLGQKWIATIAHTSTLVLLPIITYVITNVIYGNIALSLGMVGALSIVRFRNPVRSPLELSIYFGSITMGIAAAVSILWLIFLFGSFILASIVLLSAQLFSKRFLHKPFFISSFSEGNPLSTLNVTALKTITSLEESEYLTFKQVSAENIQYILATSDHKKLMKIQKSFDGSDDILSFQVTK